MLIFWKVLQIYQNNFDIFANLYIFHLKIKKSSRCKNLDIFPLNFRCFPYREKLATLAYA